MHHIAQKLYKKSAQQGFSLIEVMVALLIFSIGLMGLAGLQMEGMNGNYDAMMRTIATQHAYDMADRIRSSRAGFMINPNGVGGKCNTGNCTNIGQSLWLNGSATASDFVNDFAAWNGAIAATLPGGDGEVSDVLGAAGMVQITVRWDEHGTGTTGRVCPPPRYSDNLQCVRVRIIP